MVSGGVIGASGVVTSAGTGGSLTALEEDIARNHNDVEEIRVLQLSSRLAAQGKTGAGRYPPLLLDARTPVEYRVSRIPGAIRIDPDASEAEILAAVSDQAAGRDVVVYCSVGVRSARVIQRAGGALKDIGATGVYNLRGGIFHWHNRSLPLSNVHGSVDVVHPYSSFWQRYLKRPDQARFSHRPAEPSATGKI